MLAQTLLNRGFLLVECVTSKLALATKLDKYCHDSFESLTIAPRLRLNHLEEKNASLEECHRIGNFHLSDT